MIVIALVGAVVPADATAARPTAGARYAGLTGQRQPIVIRVATNRHALSTLGVILSVSCGAGTIERSAIQIAGKRAHTTKIAGTGRFSHTVSLSTKGRARDRLRIAGRFKSANAVTGSIRESYRNAHGVSCDSGAVTFTARLGAKVPPEQPIPQKKPPPPPPTPTPTPTPTPAPTPYVWPQGRYKGTLAVEYQIKENYQPGRWLQSTFSAVAEIGAPLTAEAGTPDKNPFRLQLAPETTQTVPGWMNVTSASPSRSLYTGAWMVDEWWLISGSNGSFSGSLNPAEIADIAGTGGGQLISYELSSLFPQGLLCWAPFELGSTMAGSFTNGALDLRLQGTGSGSCLLSLGFKAHFIGAQ